MTTFPYVGHIGEAAFEVLDTYTQTYLLAGNQPAFMYQQPLSLPAAAGVTLEQFSVVGLDAAGNVVLLDEPQTNARPIGVLAHAVDNAAGAAGAVNAQVWYSGCFNIDADSVLVWDASFATDAQKLAAFRETTGPTEIVMDYRRPVI